MQILDIFLKVVWRINVDKYKRYILAPVVLCPIISVIGFLSFNIVGYTNNWAFCFTIEHEHDTDLYFYFSVMVVVQGLGVALFLVVLFRALFWMRYSKVDHAGELDIPEEEEDEEVAEPPVIKPDPDAIVGDVENGTIANTSVMSLSMSSQTSEYLERVKVLRAPITFVAIYSINVISSLFLRAEAYTGQQKKTDLFNKWTNCMFENFYANYDALFPDDYYNEAKRNAFAQSICTASPSDGYNPTLVNIVSLAVFACSIYISLIFCKPELCFALCSCNKNRKVYSSNYDSNQSFVTMHVDEIKEYNQPSVYEE